MLRNLVWLIQSPALATLDLNEQCSENEQKLVDKQVTEKRGYTKIEHVEECRSQEATFL